MRDRPPTPCNTSGIVSSVSPRDYPKCTEHGNLVALDAQTGYVALGRDGPNNPLPIHVAVDKIALGEGDVLNNVERFIFIIICSHVIQYMSHVIAHVVHII